MSTLVTSSIGNIGNSFHIKSGTANAERLTITDAGFVGVGTTTPNSLLHVGGTTTLDSLSVGETTTISTATAVRIAASAVPTSGDHLCNKTYVDARASAVGCTIIFAQTAGTGTASLALTAGTWLCECYGGYFTCAFAAEYLKINGVTVTQFYPFGDDLGCQYVPIYGQTKITLLTPSSVVFGLFTAGTTTLQSNDAHMVCKATKVAS